MNTNNSLRSMLPTSFGSKKASTNSKASPSWAMDEDDDDSKPRLTRPPGMLLAPAASTKPTISPQTQPRPPAPPAAVDSGFSAFKVASKPVTKPLHEPPSIEKHVDLKPKPKAGLDMPIHPMLLQKAPTLSSATAGSLKASEREEEEEEDDIPGPMPSVSKPGLNTDKDEDDENEDSDDDMVGPMPAPTNADTDEDEEEEEEEDDGEEEIEFPVAQHISLVDHRRTISALALDPAGSRLITGGRDCAVKMWDFHGMSAPFRPFLGMDEPCGGNPIRDLQYSISGDQFLIASGSAQAKLYDRTGNEILWNPENKYKSTHVIPVKSKDRGGRTAITAASYSLDGKLIAAAGQDGELRVWASNGPFIMPSKSIEKAHIPGNVISSINFSLDNTTL
ncbi:hypothetical protein HDV05_000452, partial [Chytridiales sp. JEL 0842]